MSLSKWRLWKKFASGWMASSRDRKGFCLNSAVPESNHCVQRFEVQWLAHLESRPCAWGLGGDKGPEMGQEKETKQNQKLWVKGPLANSKGKWGLTSSLLDPAKCKVLLVPSFLWKCVAIVPFSVLALELESFGHALNNLLTPWVQWQYPPNQNSNTYSDTYGDNKMQHWN